MSNITTINTDNYADMAKAMGVAVTTTSTPEERLSLPRLRISHQPVMGVKSIDGEDVNVEVIKGGAFKLDGGSFKLQNDMYAVTMHTSFISSTSLIYIKK